MSLLEAIFNVEVQGKTMVRSSMDINELDSFNGFILNGIDNNDLTQSLSQGVGQRFVVLKKTTVLAPAWILEH